MRVLRLDLEYDGTDFRGFAPQPGARTVGGEIERVLERVLGEPVKVSPGARTDTGVHARGQVVTFRTGSDAAEAELKRALNALLGEDVWVRSVATAPTEFDARDSAHSRRYCYRLWNAPDRSIWERRWTVQLAGALDVPVMNEACQQLVGKHDFASFRTHRTQDEPGRSTVRRVIATEWRRSQDEPADVQFTIEADGFLRHMVRAIVGSSILVGQSRLAPSAIGEMLAAGERSAAGPTAPAQGLTLMEIKY